MAEVIPKVSVVSVTYNHEAYIREALDGFVAQKADFPIEVIVADDASTDATPAIIQEYADRYPDLIRPILRPENIGIHANFAQTLSAARGEYLALCEGDDFWTDPQKVTKQASFLDLHPEVSVCFHPVLVIHDDETPDSVFPPLLRRRNLSMGALLAGNFIQTNSVMYRRRDDYHLPRDIMPIDWYLHVLHALDGEIAMLPETMAVYRRHSQGIWYDADRNRQKFWETRGRGMAATVEAMLDLFPDNREYEQIIGRVADIIFAEMARVPGDAGRAVLLESIANHPRLAMLSFQHRWNHTPLRRIEHRLQNNLALLQKNARTYSARINPRRRTVR